jgi:hypothetical protein
MNEHRWERWSAATGYLVFALGGAAAAFERGVPPAHAPVAETLAFVTTYQPEFGIARRGRDLSQKVST